MALIQLDIPDNVGNVIEQRAVLNKFFKNGEPIDKKNMILKILADWARANEVEIDAISENIGGK